MFKAAGIAFLSIIAFLAVMAFLPWRDPYHAGARMTPLALVFGFFVFLLVWKLDAQKKKLSEEAELAEFRAKTADLNEKKG